MRIHAPARRPKVSAIVERLCGTISASEGSVLVKKLDTELELDTELAVPSQEPYTLRCQHLSRHKIGALRRSRLRRRPQHRVEIIDATVPNLEVFWHIKAVP